MDEERLMEIDGEPIVAYVYGDDGNIMATCPLVRSRDSVKAAGTLLSSGFTSDIRLYVAGNRSKQFGQVELRNAPLWCHAGWEFKMDFDHTAQAFMLAAILKTSPGEHETMVVTTQDRRPSWR